MKKRLMYMPLILASLSLGFFAGPRPAVAQVGSFSTRQHGYEHGYRDGYDYGCDIRARGAALDYRTDVYQAADRGYRAYMGPLEDYRDGYREGYERQFIHRLR